VNQKPLCAFSNRLLRVWSEKLIPVVPIVRGQVRKKTQVLASVSCRHRRFKHGICSTMDRDHLGEEGSTGRPSRSCVTRYGPRGPGSQANRKAKTNKHGLPAGDDGASHRRHPSSSKSGNRSAGTGATSWPDPALPNAYDADKSLQCMTLPSLD